MSSDCFQFLHFDLYQDRCAMKLGTDALLLGAWTETDKATDILDIGTGTGVLSLMLAQENSVAQIESMVLSAAIEHGLFT